MLILCYFLFLLLFITTLVPLITQVTHAKYTILCDSPAKLMTLGLQISNKNSSVFVCKYK